MQKQKIDNIFEKIIYYIQSPKKDIQPNSYFTEIDQIRLVLSQINNNSFFDTLPTNDYQAQNMCNIIEEYIDKTNNVIQLLENSNLNKNTIIRIGTPLYQLFIKLHKELTIYENSVPQTIPEEFLSVFDNDDYLTKQQKAENLRNAILNADEKDGTAHQKIVDMLDSYVGEQKISGRWTYWANILNIIRPNFFGDHNIRQYYSSEKYKKKQK